MPASRVAFAPPEAAATSRTATPGRAADSDARAESVSSPQQAAPATAPVDTADVAAPPASSLAAGISSVSDGGLTIVSAPSVARTAGSPAAGVDTDAAGGVRERGRAAAAGAADHRAIAKGIHAEVDLGEAGRILVHADKIDGSRVDVRLDANVAHTARMLSENAHDLAIELGSDAREARVTVSGPGTQSSVSSSSSEGANDGSSRSGGRSDSASSRRDSDHREPRNAYAHGPDTADREVTARVSRRARFVL